jgi:hypothetical protein
MKKSEAIERLALALIFSPEEVRVNRSVYYKRHIMLGNEVLCASTVRLKYMYPMEAGADMEDYVARNWNIDDCSKCEDIWQEAIWKRNGLMAKEVIPAKRRRL